MDVLDFQLNSLYKRRRTILRKKAKATYSMPVTFIKGNSFPKIVGEYWCYRTCGGRKINHPNAYAKVGWSNMIYHHSTIRVEVGKGYVKRLKISKKIKSLENITAFK